MARFGRFSPRIRLSSRVAHAEHLSGSEHEHGKDQSSCAAKGAAADEKTTVQCGEYATDACDSMPSSPKAAPVSSPKSGSTWPYRVISDPLDDEEDDVDETLDGDHVKKPQADEDVEEDEETGNDADSSRSSSRASAREERRREREERRRERQERRREEKARRREEREQRAQARAAAKAGGDATDETAEKDEAEEQQQQQQQSSTQPPLGTGFGVVGFGSTPESNRVTSTQASNISNLIVRATAPLPWDEPAENRSLLNLLKCSQLSRGCVDYVVQKLVLRLREKIDNRGVKRMTLVYKTAERDMGVSDGKKKGLELPSLRYSDAFAEDTLSLLKTLMLIHRLFTSGNEAFKQHIKKSKNLKKNLLIVGTAWNSSAHKTNSDEKLEMSARSANISAEAALVRQYALLLNALFTAYNQHAYETIIASDESETNANINSVDAQTALAEAQQLNRLFTLAMEVNSGAEHAQMNSFNGGVSRVARYTVLIEGLAMADHYARAMRTLRASYFKEWRGSTHANMRLLESYTAYRAAISTSQKLIRQCQPFMDDIVGGDRAKLSMLKDFYTEIHDDVQKMETGVAVEKTTSTVTSGPDTMLGGIDEVAPMQRAFVSGSSAGKVFSKVSLICFDDDNGPAKATGEECAGPLPTIIDLDSLYEASKAACDRCADNKYNIRIRPSNPFAHPAMRSL